MKTFYYFLTVFILTLLLIGCSNDSILQTVQPTPYENASFSRGGIMYDKFWSTESGFNQNDPNIAIFNAKSDFFRCKQCHAWDYLGRNGSYIGRGPNANRPNVANLNLYTLVQSRTPEQLFNAMKSTTNRRDISFNFNTYVFGDPNNDGHKMPNYSQILTDAQIWDIVKYLKSAIFDVSQLYDASYNGVYPTGTATYSNIGRDGNPGSGNTLYTSNCSSCHGPTGTAFLVENMTLGRFTRSKPYEVQHKVKYGQLGSSMPAQYNISLTEMKDLYKAISDTIAFPNQ